jgi:hypothetical protein
MNDVKDVTDRNTDEPERNLLNGDPVREHTDAEHKEVSSIEGRETWSGR